MGAQTKSKCRWPLTAWAHSGPTRRWCAVVQTRRRATTTLRPPTTTALALSWTNAVWCGGAGIAEGACDCEGNVLDECGVCGGDGSSCAPEEGARTRLPSTDNPEADEDSTAVARIARRQYPNTDAPDPMVIGTGIDNSHMHVSRTVAPHQLVFGRWSARRQPSRQKKLDPTHYVIGTGWADAQRADEVVSCGTTSASTWASTRSRMMSTCRTSTRSRH